MLGMLRDVRYAKGCKAFDRVTDSPRHQSKNFRDLQVTSIPLMTCVYWRNSEEKFTVHKANLTIPRQKNVFWRANEAIATISELNEIDSVVCLTNGRERAFYRWNSEDSLMNNKVFCIMRTVQA
ncbi:hypothetical protein DQG23_37020 [Paenibacillus contaminans]|uniref:Uncharacterized protein n=1 Tax=Paenibacillus contaminans TaxID=450362 RepID=A0A329LUT4_9BACL|nr:hypothetical protein DQG23_37020 [Paenibacillus contaminans]